MAAICGICFEKNTSNLLVSCAGRGCNVTVHEECYGFAFVPADTPWLCQLCEDTGSRKQVTCLACPRKSGAMKRTSTGRWAHVICAIYIPEVKFADTRMLISGSFDCYRFPPIHPPCYICKETLVSNELHTKKDMAMLHGIRIPCKEKGCRLMFHVTCALSKGLLCKENIDGCRSNYYGYCRHDKSSIIIRTYLTRNRKNLPAIDYEYDDVDELGDTNSTRKDPAIPAPAHAQVNVNTQEGRKKDTRKTENTPDTSKKTSRFCVIRFLFNRSMESAQNITIPQSWLVGTLGDYKLVQCPSRSLPHVKAKASTDEPLSVTGDELFIVKMVYETDTYDDGERWIAKNESKYEPKTNKKTEASTTNVETEGSNVKLDDSDPDKIVSLNCKTIQIGTYKYSPREKVYISSKSVEITAPSLKNESDDVTLEIKFNDIDKCFLYFGCYKLPLILLCTVDECGPYVRKTMHMTEDSGHSFDPGSNENVLKRLKLRFEMITDEVKARIRDIFGPKLFETYSPEEMLKLLHVYDNEKRTSNIRAEGSNVKVDDSNPDEIVSLKCELIKIGTYEYSPRKKVYISSRGVEITAPSLINESEDVTLEIKFNDIDKLFLKFECKVGMPAIILCTVEECGPYVRKTMHMTEDSGYEFDPNPVSNRRVSRRIKLWIEIITHESKARIRDIFGPKLIETYSRMELVELLGAYDLEKRTSKITAVASEPKRQATFDEMFQYQFDNLVHTTDKKFTESYARQLQQFSMVRQLIELALKIDDRLSQVEIGSEVDETSVEALKRRLEVNELKLGRSEAEIVDFENKFVSQQEEMVKCRKDVARLKEQMKMRGKKISSSFPLPPPSPTTP